MKKCKSMIGLLLIGAIVVLGGDALAKNNDTYEKILELKNEIIQLQNSGELGVRNFTLCSKIYTLGSYVPLPEPKIEKDGKLLLYYEPANLHTKVSEKRYEFWFTQDALLVDINGKELWSKKEFIDMHYLTSTPILDVYCHNTLTLNDVAVGKYIYTITLTDLFRNKSVTKSIEFEIVKKD